MRCLYCGRELALLKRLAGNGAFCSEGHREDYRKKFDQLALGRLRPDLPMQPQSNVVIDLGALAAGGFEGRPEPQPRPWTQSMPVPFAAEPPRAAVDLAPLAESGFRFAPVMRDFTEAKPASQRKPQASGQSTRWKQEIQVVETPRSEKQSYEKPRQDLRPTHAAWTQTPTTTERLAPIVVNLSFLGEEDEAVDEKVAEYAPVQTSSVASPLPVGVEETHDHVATPTPVTAASAPVIPSNPVQLSAQPVAVPLEAEPAVETHVAPMEAPASHAPAKPTPVAEETYWDAFDFASVNASVSALAAAVEPTPAISAKPLAAPASTPFNEFAEFIEPESNTIEVEAGKAQAETAAPAAVEIEAEPPAEASFMPLTLHGLAPSEARPMSFNRPVRVEVELRLPRWDSKPMLPGGKRAATVQPRPEAQAEGAAKPKAPLPSRESLSAPLELPSAGAPQPSAVPAAPISVFREPLDVPNRRPPVVKVAEEMATPTLPESRLPEPIAAPYTDVEIPIPSAPSEAGRGKSAAKRSNKRVMVVAGVAAILVMGWLLVGKGLFVHSASAVVAKTPPGFTVDAASPRWVHDWAPAGANAPVRYVSIVKDAADLKDFTLDFTGKIQNQAIGWVFRAKDPKNFYVEKLELLKTAGVPSASLTYFAVINGAEQRPAQLALLHDLPEDGVYKIHFEAVGSRFATSINGQEAGDFTDERLDRGSIGLYSAGDEASELQGGFQVTLAVGTKPASAPAQANHSDAKPAEVASTTKPNDANEPQKGN